MLKLRLFLLMCKCFYLNIITSSWLIMFHFKINRMRFWVKNAVFGDFNKTLTQS